MAVRGHKVRFAEPPAREEAEFGCLGDGLVALNGDDWADLESRPDELFEDLCATCRMARGKRTEEPLILSSYDAKLDGGIAGLPGALIYFYPEKLLSMLGIDLTETNSWRPVQSRTPRKFYELLAPATLVQIAHRNFLPNGWTCDKCSSQFFGYNMPWYRAFVAREEVPNDKEIVSIEVNRAVKLCISPRLWREISSTKTLRSIVGTGIGVLPNEYVDLVPKLPLRSGSSICSAFEKVAPTC